MTRVSRWLILVLSSAVVAHVLMLAGHGVGELHPLPAGAVTVASDASLSAVSDAVLTAASDGVLTAGSEGAHATSMERPAGEPAAGTEPRDASHDLHAMVLSVCLALLASGWALIAGRARREVLANELRVPPAPGPRYQLHVPPPRSIRTPVAARVVLLR
jgi:hypothetical protein